MEQTIEKTCLLIQQLSGQHLDNLTELSDGRIIPTLLAKIDPVYFKISKSNENWYEYKSLVESFLSQSGIDEEIDIDVNGIHQKDLGSIISAIFQIFSIISVFAHSQWTKALSIFDDDDDNSIVEIINRIGEKLKEEITIKKNRRASQYGSSQDIVNILKDLE